MFLSLVGLCHDEAGWSGDIPYVKNRAQEKVFPRIHSPTAPKIWTMPPKKMKTGLAVQCQSSGIDH